MVAKDLEKNKRLIFIIAALFFTILNIQISSNPYSNISLGLFAYAIFIMWGLWAAKKLSLQSLIAYCIFIFMFIIASYIGMHNSWFVSDMMKILLLASGIFVYVNIFDNQTEFITFVRLLAWLFLISIVFYIPFNLDNLYLSNRLAISQFGHGGEDLGWAAAVLYILVVLTSAREISVNKTTNNMLCVLLMITLILSLSRDAILAVFIYGVLSRQWRFILHGIIGAIISLVIFYFALIFNVFSPQAFFIQSVYRYFPASIITPKVMHFISFNILHQSMPLTVMQVMPASSSVVSSTAGISSSTVVHSAPHMVQLGYNGNLSNTWILTGRSVIWKEFLSYYWHASFLHQLFGFGIGSVTLVIKEAGFVSRDVHNLFIDILFNFGLLGLVLFLIGIIKSILIFVKTHSYESLYVLIAILAAGSFDALWRFGSILWLTSLIAATPYIYLKFFREEK